MRELSYKVIFSRYNLSISDRLAQYTDYLYKTVRPKISKVFPLKDYEKHQLNVPSWRKHSDVMPKGYDYITQKEEEGYLKLKYLDLFDYLPKENLDTFKRELKSFVTKNKIAPYGMYFTIEDEDRIDKMGRYIDSKSFSRLMDIQFNRNKYLEQYSPQVTISLINLSPSFLVVKYRFYTSEEFTKKINDICTTSYPPFSDVSRRYNVPWYSPRKFGRAMYSGNDARSKELYMQVSKLKYQAFLELKRNFTIYFEQSKLFPPTFETYTTNIRPNKANSGFWDSVMLSRLTDYAPEYNACVNFEYDCGQYEGKRYAAYCGEGFSESDSICEIATYEIADIYSVYVVANNINRIVERDIALFNKQISKVVLGASTIRILEARVSIKQKLYYGYRFISEFTGETIELDEVKDFHNQLYREGSISKSSLSNISKITAETKKQTDLLLNMLGATAEYSSAKLNMRLQWIMVIITLLSLIITFFAIKFGN